MARLVTLIGITAALAVSPAAWAFKKAEPAAPAAAPAPAPTPAPEQPAPTTPTVKEQAGKEQGGKAVAPAVPAAPVATPAPTPKPAPVAPAAVPQQPAAKASSAPVVKPAEAPKPAASAPAQKSPAAPPTPPSQADAQRQLDAELAKLKALQGREAAKIKAMPADPYSQKGGAVSRESRDYLKGLNSVFDGGGK